MQTNSSAGRAWYCVHCIVEAEHSEGVCSACFDLGSCGLQTESDAHQVHVRAYFPVVQNHASPEAALAEAIRSLGVQASLSTSIIAEADWSTGWRKYFRPVWATPRIVVCPPWSPVRVQPGQIVLTIDPKMAFGTGTHESTQLCLQALEHTIRPDSLCLDVGTGSGILALAALRLGARHAVAVDVDPVAIENARENFRLNGIPESRVDVLTGSVDQVPEGTFDVIVANIRSTILEPMLPALCRRVAREGGIILSGLLKSERESFGARVADAGLEVRSALARNEWLCMLVALAGEHA